MSHNNKFAFLFPQPSNQREKFTFFISFFIQTKKRGIDEEFSHLFFGPKHSRCFGLGLNIIGHTHIFVIYRLLNFFLPKKHSENEENSRYLNF